jgi:hypothetical protein
VLPHILVLAFGAALAIVATYPLIREVSDHVVGSLDYHDPVCFAWNNWWIHHALLNLGSKPYLTDFLFAPFSLDLRLHTLGLLYGLLSLPLVTPLGPITLVNLQILGTPVLNGYAVFLLVRRWAGRDDVAVVCGAGLATTPAIAFHLYAGRPSCGAIWPVALVLLFLMRLVEWRRWRDAFGLTASSLALLAVDQQMALFGGMLGAIYVACIAMARPQVLRDWRLLRQSAFVSLLVAYPIWMLYVGPFLQSPGYTVPDPSEALVYSMPPGYLLTRGLWITYGAVLPLGLVAALAFARRDRKAMFAAAVAVAFCVLTLGPVWPGTRVPLPFALLRRMPGMGMFRTPYRFQIPAAIAMTLVLARVMSRTPSGPWRGVLVGTAALVFTAQTGLRRAIDGFDSHAVSIEAIYRIIADTPGDFSVLEVPFGVRSGSDVIGKFGDRLMLYQTTHHKRMFNGYLSRVPLAALAYYRSSPAFMFLAGERPPPGDVSSDLDARLRDLDVGYIVLHPEMIEAHRLAEISALLSARGDLDPIATGTATRAFRVRR